MKEKALAEFDASYWPEKWSDLQSEILQMERSKDDILETMMSHMSNSWSNGRTKILFNFMVANNLIIQFAVN